MGDLEETANIFTLLAEVDFKHASPRYESLTLQAAEDPEVLSVMPGGCAAGPVARTAPGWSGCKKAYR